MSSNPGFFQRPLIPRQPYPEPPGFNLLRYQQMMNYFQNQQNPYGMTPYSSGPSQLNPYGGRGNFNPYQGGYGPQYGGGGYGGYGGGGYRGFGGGYPGFGGFGGGGYGGGDMFQGGGQNMGGDMYTPGQQQQPQPQQQYQSPYTAPSYSGGGLGTFGGAAGTYEANAPVGPNGERWDPNQHQDIGQWGTGAVSGDSPGNWKFDPKSTPDQLNKWGQQLTDWNTASRAAANQKVGPAAGGPAGSNIAEQAHNFMNYNPTTGRWEGQAFDTANAQGTGSNIDYSQNASSASGFPASQPGPTGNAPNQPPPTTTNDPNDPYGHGNYGGAPKPPGTHVPQPGDPDYVMPSSGTTSDPNTPAGLTGTPVTPGTQPPRTVNAPPPTGDHQTATVVADGQTGVTNPTPYPHEYSPQPYDGNPEQAPWEDLSDVARRHIERQKLMQDFLPLVLAQMAKTPGPRPTPMPTPPPTPQPGSIEGVNTDAKTLLADRMANRNFDGVAYDGPMAAPPVSRTPPMGQPGAFGGRTATREPAWSNRPPSAPPNPAPPNNTPPWGGGPGMGTSPGLPTRPPAPMPSTPPPAVPGAWGGTTGPGMVSRPAPAPYTPGNWGNAQPQPLPSRPTGPVTGMRPPPFRPPGRGYDGESSAPTNELGTRGSTRYAGMPMAMAPHVRVPLSLPPTGLGRPTGGRSAMGTAAGLNRLLSGISGATRRGQMAANRVGRGGAYDGNEVWRTGSPPPGSRYAPPTVPATGKAAYEGVVYAGMNDRPTPGAFGGTSGYSQPVEPFQGVQYDTWSPTHSYQSPAGGDVKQGQIGAGSGGGFTYQDYVNQGGGFMGNPQANPGNNWGGTQSQFQSPVGGKSGYSNTPGNQFAPPGQIYPTGAQNMGAPLSPWLMPWEGNFTAPMSQQEQQGLGGMSNFVGQGMGLGAAGQYNTDVLNGRYIGSANPYMNQIQGGMQTLKDFQDEQARKRIGSSMAAGGNALSGARASTEQQYQNLSDANFNQNIGNMQLQNLARERALQNQGVSQAQGLSNTQMGGYGSLMQAGALPRNLQQQDTNAQYQDWLRQIGGMQSQNRYQDQLANQMLHSGYPGSADPNYGQSAAAGWGGLIASLLGGGGGSGGGGLLDLIKGIFAPKKTDPNAPQKPPAGGGPSGGGGPGGNPAGKPTGTDPNKTTPGGTTPVAPIPNPNQYGAPIGPNMPPDPTTGLGTDENGNFYVDDPNTGERTYLVDDGTGNLVPDTSDSSYPNATENWWDNPANWDTGGDNSGGYDSSTGNYDDSGYSGNDYGYGND